MTDSGPGPTDPLVGLFPNEPRTDNVDDTVTEPALGLWLVQQLVEVSRRSDPSGYTIRLTATHPVTHT